MFHVKQVAWAVRGGDEADSGVADAAVARPDELMQCGERNRSGCAPSGRAASSPCARAALLADAEASENLVEDIFDIDPAHQRIERPDGTAQFLGHKIGMVGAKVKEAVCSC